MTTQRGRFAEATAITTRPGPGSAGTGTASDGRFAATVRPGWDILGNPNGGYLLAIVARALVAATGRPDPISITGHFLDPASPGPVTVDVTELRSGGRYSTARALLAGDRAVLAAIGTCGDLGATRTRRWAEVHITDASPPELPEPDDCTPVREDDPAVPPLMRDKVELRLHPEDAGFAEGRPSGMPRMRGWFRLPHGEPVDTVALVCALDAFPPTVFNASLPVGWAPTLELTAHLRARPGPGWLACAFSTRFVTGGLLEVDGEIWDGSMLVAQSRQLALVPAPPDSS